MQSLLYIEDNLYNVQLIKRLLLQRPDVTLLTSVQGSAGIALAQQRRPDLILLDVHLPDISGYDVLQRLKLEPETSTIPVVVLSADATPGQIRRFHEGGANDYLTKPLDLKRLLAVLAEYLGAVDPAASELDLD